MQIISAWYHITTTEPILGSASGNPDIHREYIAARAKDAAKEQEETQAVAPTAEEIAEQVEKSSTIFPRDKNGLFLWDYQVRGFFKEAMLALIELGDVPENLTKWSYKRAVDSFLFVMPRRVYLFQEEAKLKSLKNGDFNNLPTKFIWKKAEQTNERPLRAQTMQGERIALARSEQLPAGTQALFKVEVLAPGMGKKTSQGKKPRKTSAVIDLDLIESCLDYGARKGWGQWRGGGWGRFLWKRNG
jgi:hypothetical protein